MILFLVLFFNFSFASNDQCIVDATAIEDYKKIKEEIEKSKKEISDRESILKLKEKSLQGDLEELKKMKDELKNIKELKKKELEEKTIKTVETILAMNPRVAAKLLSTVDEKLAILIISKIETQKLAKIMNFMDPKKISDLTEVDFEIKKEKNKHVN